VAVLPEPSVPAVRLKDASLAYGARVVLDKLNVTVQPSEFLAVLGPNGAGKTTLLRVLLGLQALTSGTVEVRGVTPRRASRHIGYVPQQRAFDPDLPIRGRDLVQLGLDGHRYGLPIPRRKTRRLVDEAVEAVGAGAFAHAPVGMLSGGEQQRLRIAQALLGDPELLLCDEPLLSLDLAHQRAVTELIDERRRRAGTAVVFVTHEINPVLPFVDRVLYLVGGRWAIGAPGEVLTSQRLSELYGTPVDVLRVQGRIVVVGSDESVLSEPAGHAHHLHVTEDKGGQRR